MVNDHRKVPPVTTVLPLGGGHNDYRNRLLDGMANSLAERGYAETTVADIVREAGVSKRTFYQHFSTKQDCLLALYQAASQAALMVLRSAVDPEKDWASQVEHALGTYLACLASQPRLLRTLFIEILHLGQPGLAVRRAMYQELADFIVQVVPDNRSESDRQAMPMATLTMAIVGGVNELALEAIENDRADRLADLTPAASWLVRSVLAAPA